MKSAYKIAKEIGVSPQAIYKRLTTDFKAQLADHIEENGNKTLFDEIAEQQIKRAFNKADQAIGIGDVKQPVDEPVYRLVEQPSIQLHTNGSSTLDIDLLSSPNALSVEQAQSKQSDSHSAIDPNELITKMMISQRQEMAELLSKFDRFVDVLEKPMIQSKPRVDEPLANELVEQLQTENHFLRQQNQDLTEELKVEREHGRNQAVKLSDLMTQYSEITKNQQILLGREQGLNNSGLILNSSEDEPVSFNEVNATVTKEDEKEKKSFWQKIFGRK